MTARLVDRLSALALMRRESQRQLEAVVGSPSQRTNVRGSGTGTCRSWLSGLWESRIRIRRLRTAIAAKPAIVVATSATRLPIDGRIRQSIHALLAPLPGCDGCPEPYLDDVSNATLIVVEPTNVTALHRLCGWNEHVIDQRLIVHLIAWSPLTAMRAILLAAAMFRAKAAAGSACLASAREVIAAAVFTTAFQYLFDAAARIRGLLLTSNSFSVEILRYQLLEHPRNAGVIEVLHGVPMTAWAAYLETVYETVPLDASGPSFIAQIPGLTVRPGLRARMDPGQAINTLINNRLRNWVPGETWFRDQISAMLGTTARTKSTIIAIVGGTSFDTDYATSAPFKLECELIGLIRAAFASEGRECMFVYAPHPANGSAAFANCPALKRDDVRVYQDSILSWLVADQCVGLYSSGLFEAGYVGSAVFSPMRKSDDLYDGPLLDLIGHAGDHGERLTHARIWAEEQARRPQDDETVVARVMARFRLLTCAGAGSTRSVVPA